MCSLSVHKGKTNIALKDEQMKTAHKQPIYTGAMPLNGTGSNIWCLSMMTLQTTHGDTSGQACQQTELLPPALLNCSHQMLLPLQCNSHPQQPPKCAVWCVAVRFHVVTDICCRPSQESCAAKLYKRIPRVTAAAQSPLCPCKQGIALPVPSVPSPFLELQNITYSLACTQQQWCQRAKGPINVRPRKGT